jgi:ribonuclease P protein component
MGDAGMTLMPAAPEDLSAMSPSPGRLKRRSEFLRVAAKGRKAPMPGLVLQRLARDDDAPARLGFTATKKVGNAVVRNRTRRRLKEAARLLLREQPLTGVDLVLIGRDGTRSRTFVALQDDLRRALSRTARDEPSNRLSSGPRDGSPDRPKPGHSDAAAARANRRLRRRTGVSGAPVDAAKADPI